LDRIPFEGAGRTAERLHFRRASLRGGGVPIVAERPKGTLSITNIRGGVPTPFKEGRVSSDAPEDEQAQGPNEGRLQFRREETRGCHDYNARSDELCDEEKPTHCKTANLKGHAEVEEKTS